MSRPVFTLRFCFVLLCSFFFFFVYSFVTCGFLAAFVPICIAFQFQFPFLLVSLLRVALWLSCYIGLCSNGAFIHDRGRVV